MQEARRELAAAFPGDLRRIDVQLRDAKKKLAVTVAAAGTSLTGLFGVGPVIAACPAGSARAGGPGGQDRPNLLMTQRGFR